MPLVQLLLESDADAAARTLKGETALALARAQLTSGVQEDGRHREVAALLLAKLAPLLKATVRVHGLVGRPQLNGQVGNVVLYDEPSGRYGVQLADEAVRLLPKNVARAEDAP